LFIIIITVEIHVELVLLTRSIPVFFTYMQRCSNVRYLVSSIVHHEWSSHHSCCRLIIAWHSDEGAANIYTLLEGVYRGDLLRMVVAFSCQYVVRNLPCQISKVSSEIFLEQDHVLLQPLYPH